MPLILLSSGRASLESVRECPAALLLPKARTLLEDGIEGSCALGIGGECLLKPLLEEGRAPVREAGRFLPIRSLNCRSSTDLRPFDEDTASAGVLVRICARELCSESRSTANSSLTSVKRIT